MRIPVRFKLLGQTISVVYNPLLVNESDWTGVAKYRNNVIEIMPSNDSHPRSDDKIEHTFMHELIHFIMFYAGSSRHETTPNQLHTDEGFVDAVAGLLHQALTTMEYAE